MCGINAQESFNYSLLCLLCNLAVEWNVIEPGAAARTGGLECLPDMFAHLNQRLERLQSDILPICCSINKLPPKQRLAQRLRQRLL